MIDPVDMLPTVRQVAETGEASLHLRRHLCQQVDCLFGDFHERVSSYSASECGCLVLWLRLAGRFVAVDVRAAA